LSRVFTFISSAREISYKRKRWWCWSNYYCSVQFFQRGRCKPSSFYFMAIKLTQETYCSGYTQRFPRRFWICQPHTRWSFEWKLRVWARREKPPLSKWHPACWINNRLALSIGASSKFSWFFLPLFYQEKRGKKKKSVVTMFDLPPLHYSTPGSIQWFNTMDRSWAGGRGLLFYSTLQNGTWFRPISSTWVNLTAIFYFYPVRLSHKKSLVVFQKALI